MDAYDSEYDIGVRLKDSLDIRDLRDPSGKGAEFEIDENDLQTSEREEGTEVTKEFDKNRVAANICWLSEDDEEEDEANTGSEYLTEMERLRKRLENMEGSDITTKKDKGVLKQLKSHGVGGRIPPESLVCFHYNGYTDVGQAPFDSSKLRDAPLKVRLGKGQCIIGLEMALLTMKRQESARFLIRHDYAFGDMGCPPRIPQAASLIYDVEVLWFVQREGVEDYFSMTPAERKARMTYVDVEKVAKSLMSEGNENFGRQHYVAAKAKYNKAIRVMEEYHLKNEEEESRCNVQLKRSNRNAAICEWKLGEYGRTISHCNNVLAIDKNDVKALYFKGKALHSLSDFEKATRCLQRARELNPTDKDISKALQQLASSRQRYSQLEKDLCRRMFSNPTADEHSSGPTKTQVEEEEATFGKCSNEFKAKVEERLREFKEDADMSEMPFPQIQMSEAEINCILETAQSLGGLNVRERGTGNSTRYEVYKKKQK